MSDPIRPTDPQLYLGRVAARLGLPPAVEQEVVEELAAHVADATAALIAEGLAPEQAEREALARLGSPEALADEIRRAQQTPRRLATAGARGVFWLGWTGLFWILSSFLFVFVAQLALWIVLGFLGAWSGGADLPLGQAVGAGPYVFVFGAGAFFGAREAVLVAARASRRRVAAVGRWFALAGAPVVAVLALVVFEVDLDPLAVVGLALVPVAFVAGCLAGPRVHWPAHPVRWAAAASVAALLLVAIAALGGPATRTWGSPPIGNGMGFERVAASLPPGSEPLVDGASATGSGYPAARLSFDWAPVVVFTAWHDLRLEAWRGTARDGGIAPDATGPYAVATPDDTGGSLRFTIRVNGRPEVTHYWLVLTGADAAGKRWILAPPTTGWTSFHGSVADWLRAVLAPQP